MGEETLDWAAEAVPTHSEALRSFHEQDGSNSGGSAALRVHQWEAGVLDGELRGLLKGGLIRALRPSMLSLKPEVDALLRPPSGITTVMFNGVFPLHWLALCWRDRFMEFSGSVAAGLPTPGMRIAGLKHSPSLSWRRRVVLGVLVVLFPWLLIRLRIRLTREGRLNALRWLDSVEGVVSLAKVLNMLAFLRGGKFPSLEDRLSGVALEYNMNDRRSRSGWDTINYTFLGRRLLFDAFTGASDAFSRLADWNTVRLWMARHIGIWKRRHRRSTLQTEGSSGGLETDEEKEVTAAENLILTSCVECGANPPCMPHLATCGHLFCYLCCAAHYDGGHSCVCPECGEWLDSLAWVHHQSPSS